MGTSNYWPMRNFDIYCLNLEYDEGWYDEMYPELDARTREEIWEQDSESIYNEVWTKIEDSIDDETWMFHSAEMRSGYYEGIQIYMKEPELKYLDLDLEGFYEDKTGRRCKHNKREMRHRYWKEVNRIREWLERVKEENGLDVLMPYARFSNGETWYVYRKDREEVKTE